MRHGRSRADDEEVHEGRYDSPLTEVGYAQAQARAQEFLARGITFDVVVCSPLQRARETARVIAQALGVPVETDANWMERDNGPLAGMRRDVAAIRHPKPDFRSPYEPFCGTGESEWELYVRAARAVEKVVRRGRGKYLIVAHGGVLLAAMDTIMGRTPTGDRHGLLFAFGDTGYARLTYHPDRHLWLLQEFRAA